MDAEIRNTTRNASLAVALMSALFVAGFACRQQETDALPNQYAERVRKAPASPHVRESDKTLVDTLFGRNVRQVVVPDGTKLEIRLTSSVSSQESYVNDKVTGEVVEPVAVDGVNVIPAGSTVSGAVTAVSRLHRVGGQARVAFELTRLVTPDGVEHPISLHYDRTARSETPRDTATIAGGALAGVILGQQLGHDRTGRVIGGLAGAGAGTAIAARTAGERISLPTGTVIRLTLLDAVRIDAST